MKTVLAALLSITFPPSFLAGLAIGGVVCLLTVRFLSWEQP